MPKRFSIAVGSDQIYPKVQLVFDVRKVLINNSISCTISELGHKTIFNGPFRDLFANSQTKADKFLLYLCIITLIYASQNPFNSVNPL